MSPQPLVSVLMPVRNTSAYLPAALDSILNQSLGQFEVVALDDGSTDGSDRILATRAATDLRLRIIPSPKGGLIAARNALLHAATADLVAWMDSDDLSAKDRLERQVRMFGQDDELVCLGTSARQIDPDGELLGLESYPLDHDGVVQQQKHGGAMRFPTSMMRRSVALKVGGFREPFRMGEDFDLLLRMGEVGRMANLPDVLYFYRQHLSGVTSTLGGTWIRTRDLILELAEERRLHGLDRLQRGQSIECPNVQTSTTARRWKAEVLRSWASAAMAVGDPRRASSYLRQGLLQNPLNWRSWSDLYRAVTARIF